MGGRLPNCPFEKDFLRELAEWMMSPYDLSVSHQGESYCGRTAVMDKDVWFRFVKDYEASIPGSLTKNGGHALKVELPRQPYGEEISQVFRLADGGNPG
jgi:hypothetical protein